MTEYMYLVLQNNYMQTPKTAFNWSDFFSTMGQVFSLLIIFMGVLFLAYYSTKMIASARHYGRKNSNIHFIENFSMGQNSHLRLVKVANKTILIAVSKENITFITEVDEDQLNDEEKTDTVSNKTKFDKYFNIFSKDDKQ
jgi:flagellar protein FliO/FliZ